MNKSERDNKGRKQAHDGAVNATSVFPSEENAGDGADVERTISSIKKEKEEAANVSKKKNGFITAVKIIFFPVTGIVWCVRKMFRTINMPLTAKMTLIYSLIFAIVLAGFTVFFIASMDKTAGEEMKGYISTLIITACGCGERFVRRHGLDYESIYAQAHTHHYREHRRGDGRQSFGSARAG